MAPGAGSQWRSQHHYGGGQVLLFDHKAAIQPFFLGTHSLSRGSPLPHADSLEEVGHHILTCDPNWAHAILPQDTDPPGIRGGEGGVERGRVGMIQLEEIKQTTGTSLEVVWLLLSAAPAGPGSCPAQGEVLVCEPLRTLAINSLSLFLGLPEPRKVVGSPRAVTETE